jgi:hypothetical protein
MKVDWWPLPDDFLLELASNDVAKTLWKPFSFSNDYALLYKLTLHLFPNHEPFLGTKFFDQNPK